MELTVQEMARLLRVPVTGKPLRGQVELCTDSRTMQAGQVFWALRGLNFDGHGFVEESFKKGGVAAVVEREWYEQNGRPARVYVPVGDTQQALQSLAVRRRISLPGKSGQVLIRVLTESKVRALLEAASFHERASTLMALLEMGGADGPTTVN